MREFRNRALHTRLWCLGPSGFAVLPAAQTVVSAYRSGGGTIAGLAERPAHTWSHHATLANIPRCPQYPSATRSAEVHIVW